VRRGYFSQGSPYALAYSPVTGVRQSLDCAVWSLAEQLSGTDDKDRLGEIMHVRLAAYIEFELSIQDQEEHVYVTHLNDRSTTTREDIRAMKEKTMAKLLETRN
jgi:hypothetical protein